MKRLIAYFLVGVLACLTLIKARIVITSPFIVPCSTYLIIQKKQQHLNLLIDFVSIDNNGTGVLTVSGTYFDKDIKIGVMRRLINYQWELKGTIYNLTATEIRKDDRDESLSEDEIESWVPHFFSRQHGKISLTVSVTGNSGYIFSTGVRPLFFCERTK